MKYNILINQVKSAEWELTTSEAMLFAWLYELPSWAEKMTYNGDVYFYANRGKACEEMPLVSEKKDTIYRLYKSLQNKNLISFITIKGNDFVSITEKGKKWYRDSEQDSEKNPNDGNSSKKAENNPTNNIYNNKEIDNKKENKDNKLSLSKKKQNFDVRADLSYVDSKYANLWNEWLDYKDAINKQYKTQKGAISQYKSWIKFANNNIILAEAIVRRSIEYSWQGLFELKDNEIKLYLSNRNPYRSNNQQPNNGSNRLIDGENEDGTFNRNGYRYYHSMRDNRDYSIPINAVPMPSFDCEFDMKTEKWYHPDIKNDVNGDLW